MVRGEGAPPASGVTREPRRLVVRPAAEGDMAEAFRWYEERSPGLGEAFASAVE